MTVVSFVIVGVSYIVVGNIVKSDMSGEIFFIWVCNMSIIGLSRLITAQLYSLHELHLHLELFDCPIN